MKRTILKSLMLTAALLTGSNALAHHFEVDGIYYNRPTDDYRARVAYKGDTYDAYSDEYTGDLIIPDSVIYKSHTYTVSMIAYRAFRGCSQLNSVTVPNTVTRIDDEAFMGTTSLKELCFEDGESELWLGYNRYESSGTGDGLFDDCYNIESIYLGRNIDYQDEYKYGYSPFYNLPCLKSLTIGNCVTRIPYSAFAACTKLTDIVIPNSVTEIDVNAFASCSGLKKLTLGNCVATIGNFAFMDCGSLTSITIPGSVTEFGSGVFYGCTGLTEIINEAAIPQTINNGTFEKVPTTATLYVPIGSKEAYSNAEGWKNFENIIEKEMSSVKAISSDSNVNVSVKNETIVVTGVDRNADIKVYNMSGQCVYNGNDTTIPIHSKALYIVKVNNDTFKIII